MNFPLKAKNVARIMVINFTVMKYYFYISVIK